GKFAVNNVGYVWAENIHARGNIEATSLTVNNANIVETLHVAGNAISLPVANSGGNGTQLVLDRSYILGNTRPISWGWAPAVILVTCSSSLAGTVNIQYWNGGSWVTHLVFQVAANAIDMKTVMLSLNGGWGPGITTWRFWSADAGSNVSGYIYGLVTKR
ncbi:MAG TPA: hypothetical protein PK177_13525, partial [Burkholderiaceae bacterium]|nr:hypothetical protein [Burkholderiaceae bacterium]